METIICGGRMHGKSWAQLHIIFQRWVVTSFQPLPDSETIDLMWYSWQKSHELHLAGKRAEIAMLKDDNERLRQELGVRDAGSVDWVREMFYNAGRLD
jgi:hypothetical protein